MNLASIAYEADPAKQRVVIHFVGELEGPGLRQSMDALWREQPLLPEWDSICDMLEFTGDFSFDDIKALAEAWRAFCGRADLGRRTAIVSRDPFAPLYIKAIGLCFPGRELAVFRSLSQAQRWLDRVES